MKKNIGDKVPVTIRKIKEQNTQVSLICYSGKAEYVCEYDVRDRADLSDVGPTTKGIITLKTGPAGTYWSFEKLPEEWIEKYEQFI
jgi:hypothetical protein